jgi:hypothetical protein
MSDKGLLFSGSPASTKVRHGNVDRDEPQQQVLVATNTRRDVASAPDHLSAPLNYRETSVRDRLAPSRPQSMDLQEGRTSDQGCITPSGERTMKTNTDCDLNAQ